MVEGDETGKSFATNNTTEVRVFAEHLGNVFQLFTAEPSLQGHEVIGEFIRAPNQAYVHYTGKN